MKLSIAQQSVLTKAAISVLVLIALSATIGDPSFISFKNSNGEDHISCGPVKCGADGETTAVSDAIDNLRDAGYGTPAGSLAAANGAAIGATVCLALAVAASGSYVVFGTKSSLIAWCMGLGAVGVVVTVCTLISFAVTYENEVEEHTNEKVTYTVKLNWIIWICAAIFIMLTKCISSCCYREPEVPADKYVNMGAPDAVVIAH